MVIPLGIIVFRAQKAYTTLSVRPRVYTQLRLIKTAYMLTLNVYAGSLHKSRVYTWVAFTKVAYTLWHIIFIIFLALTGIVFSVTSELICRYIILTSLAHRLLIIGNSSSRFPSRTTHYIILLEISPLGLDGNHDGVWSSQQIDTLIITIMQTPWYSPPLTSRAKGGSKPKQGFSSLIEIRAL